MKLIPLEEVIKLLNEYQSSNTNKIIQSLPESIDPIAIIDEMILDAEIRRDVSDGNNWFHTNEKVMYLKELKSRLSLTK